MSEPSPIPINALFGSDFVTELVVITDQDTMDEVAGKVAHHVIGKRIKPRDAAMAVYLDGKRLPSGATAGEFIPPLSYVVVDYVDEPDTAGATS